MKINLEEMMEKKITFTIEAPTDCTEKQFDEWLKFNIGMESSMLINKLSKYPLNLIATFADPEILHTCEISNPKQRVVIRWLDMDDAPLNEPLILIDEKDFVYVGEYDHNYGYFARYTNEGLVEHQHAVGWRKLPSV